MRTKIYLHIIAALLLLLAGCSPNEPVEDQVCGDDICAAGEDAGSCPQDCGHTPISGEIFTTFINSEGVGQLAVLVAYPSQTRFTEGAGVVVVIPPFLTEQTGFTTEPDFTSIGLIQISFLWPGATDEEFALSSEGEYDYGGEIAIQALRDVINFATGRLPNEEGRLITTLLPVKPLVDEVGIFSYAHAGIATTNVLSLYGSEMDGLEYLVGYENPTTDTLTTLEAGYIDGSGLIQQNPFYQFPSSYSQMKITLNFGTARWEPEFSDDSTLLVGRPYLDLDGNSLFNDGDFLFTDEIPVVAGKRYYSSALTQALLDTGSLTLAAWPATLATPEESTAFWSSRQSPQRYMDFVLQSPNLKVMLVFANRDHAQAAADKPHIHQAFQGFRFAALLRWVRLNPDRTYMQQATGISDFLYPDNPANTQPEDWWEIADWAFDGDSVTWQVASLAALAEMSDRAHTGRWDENLGSPLYQYTLATPTP
jgi:hypothetical protein